MRPVESRMVHAIGYDPEGVHSGDCVQLLAVVSVCGDANRLLRW
ncbi:MAG: hypothetical protein ACUVR2_02775 [Anaerolineae bacterium]